MQITRDFLDQQIDGFRMRGSTPKHVATGTKGLAAGASDHHRAYRAVRTLTIDDIMNSLALARSVRIERLLAANR